MRLSHGIQLGYCTNIHRGGTWEETFSTLRTYTDAVRQRVAPEREYGIGLRLSADAASELASDAALGLAFRRWLEESNSYVYTINGFPYGIFHGSRVKEQVFAPDWTTTERLEYTKTLFDLIATLAPEGEEGSVSTLPGSFKAFVLPETAEDQRAAIIRNLRECSDYIERLRDRTGRDLHLGLEPEPLGLFENTPETLAFFDQLLAGTSESEAERIRRNIGVNYDTCHLAVEYESPHESLSAIREAGIRVSKIHLSSALRLKPTSETLTRLREFQEGVYLHQVIVAEGGQVVKRFKDLPEALEWQAINPEGAGEEWRVHFHIPIHTAPESGFSDTRDHLLGTLDEVEKDPSMCRHFEMETYTWEVMPEPLRSGDVVDQLAAEYEWCLAEMARRGLA